jgi:hypothetical protein
VLEAHRGRVSEAACIGSGQSGQNLSELNGICLGLLLLHVRPNGDGFGGQAFMEYYSGFQGVSTPAPAPLLTSRHTIPNVRACHLSVLALDGPIYTGTLLSAQHTQAINVQVEGVMGTLPTLDLSMHLMCPCHLHMMRIPSAI